VRTGASGTMARVDLDVLYWPTELTEPERTAVDLKPPELVPLELPEGWVDDLRTETVRDL